MSLDFTKEEICVLVDVLFKFKAKGLHHIMPCSDLAILTNLSYKLLDYYDTFEK